jgi:hypothetical protein
VIAGLLQEGGSSAARPVPLFLEALLAATASGAGRPYRNELRRLRRARVVDV